MINKETDLIMQKICRSCMCESTEMKSVFETKEAAEGKTLQIADMLMACASIQIISGDGLPVQMCFSCETKLNLAFEFKEQCEKTDTTLRELTNQPIPKRNIKEESLDIVVQPDFNITDLYTDGGTDSDGTGSFKEATKSKDSGIFTCSYCKKILRTKKGLKIHQRRHTGEKLRSCHLCQAKFTRTNHLRRHLETHNKVNQEGLHICIECGASFEKAFHLAKHRKVHKLGNSSIKKESDIEIRISNGDYDDDLEKNDVNTDQQTNDDEQNMEIEISGQDDQTDEYKSNESEKTIEKEKKIMECEFCDRKFKYRKSFVHHMQTEHGMSDESDVPLSSYSANTENLKIESKNNQGAQLHEAKDLGYQENFDDGLNEIDDTDILMSLDSRKLHSCHVCASKFARANHLTRHMTLHRAVLIHKCDRCDKAFASADYLAKHTQQDHIDRPYICTICNRTFSRGEHLIRHLKIHNTNEQGENLKCSICEKVFTRSDCLARHTKVHLKQDKRHVCSECGKAFNRLDNLKTHQRIHTGLKDNSRLHLCIYCGKEFNNSSNMIVHMRRHTGERPYKCNICGKGFPRSHDLKCHERTHSGEKPYLCTLCGKSFNKSNKLLRHTRVHTGERPYVCNLCGRAFTQSNDLALHMRRHTGSRPYACGVCSARFIQSGQLKSHRRSTGHWMEIQPDLKGGHRVEPVTPLVNPTPIKFKTHGKFGLKTKDENLDEEMKEPRILNQTVGIMGNISIQNELASNSQPIIIESTKLLQQFHSAGFVEFTSVINATEQSTNDLHDSKYKNEPTYSITNITREGNPVECTKLEIVQTGDVTFSTVGPTVTTFSNTDRYNYQNYG